MVVTGKKGIVQEWREGEKSAAYLLSKGES